MAGRLLRHIARRARQLAPVGAGEATDRQLLERFVSQRDEAAFAAIVRRHGPLVLGVARRVLRHEQDAEDVFQATFLILTRHASARRWQPSIAGWLYSVAYRLALRTSTRRIRRHAVETAAPAHAPLPASQEHADLSASLDEELQRLADGYRDPLLLCYLQSKTRDQAARQLGWSLRTLERRLNQGLSLLRARLGKRGVDVPVALLAAGLSQQAASAALAPALLASTVEAAAAPAEAELSAGVAALVEAGSRALVWSKIKVGLALLLVVSAAVVLIVSAQNPPPAVHRPNDAPAVEQRPAAPKATTPAPTVWEAGTPVRGRVVDHRGMAVANAEVLLLGQERIIVEANRSWFVFGPDRTRPRPPSVRTDAEGGFGIERKEGAADRLVVIADGPLFWSVPRRSLRAAGAVEVKLPQAGSLALRCDLPGRAARQPVNIELHQAGRETDFLRFHFGSHAVANPGEALFENLPPGDYVVERIVETPTEANTVHLTQADRQLAKVEAGKQTTVHLSRQQGRPLNGRVRGLENEKLRYAHVTIGYFASPEPGRDAKPVRNFTAFDVLSISADGRFTTDPMPPGKYILELFAVRAATPAAEGQRSNFQARLEFTVPEQGEMPVVEVVARSTK